MTMQPPIARRVRVTGRVQGVFFRGWTAEQAGKLGLVGWVRNCADGSVEAHVQGEASAVEALIERIRRGPSGARVDAVAVEDAAFEPLSGFAVRR